MSEYVSDPLPEPSVRESVEPTTQEVVQNVQEILTIEPAVQEVSTESVDNSNQNELEERLKDLEEKHENLVKLLKSIYSEYEHDDNEFRWTYNMLDIREKLIEM